MKDRRSPQARSRAFMEDRGWIVEVVERRMTRTLVKDAFGFADLLAIRDGEAMLIQVTDHTNHSKRARKCRVFKGALRAWLSTEGHTVEVQSWHTQKKEPRRERIDVD